jgi:hypothetical protein
MNRSDYLGSSDAAKVLDESQWNLLYQEKMGLVEREDLSDVFPVQYGVFTEPFHLDWLIKEKAGWSWSKDKGDGQHYANLKVGDVPLGSHPDALIKVSDGSTMCCEVKTSSRFRSTEECAEYYMGQLQTHMLVWGHSEIYFSVIIGTSEPTPIFIGASEEWQSHYCEMAQRFWSHITTKTPPSERRERTVVPINITNTVPINGMLNRDVSASNQITSLIAVINKAKPHIKAEKDAKTEMKTLIEDGDASLYIPNVMTYKRNAKGTPVLRITDEGYGL